MVKLFPYMRGYNYTFKKLDKKIKSICALKDEHPNLKVNVNAAYQIFNILDIELFISDSDVSIFISGSLGIS